VEMPLDRRLVYGWTVARSTADQKPRSFLKKAVLMSQRETTQCRKDGMATNAITKPTTSTQPIIDDKRVGGGG
jgi:hypothetical protein